MKKAIRSAVIVVICALLIVGYYYYLSNRNGSGAQDKAKKESPVEQLLSLDLNLKYPSTPREVVKVYNRFLKCFYNEDCSEKEFLKLAEKQRVLFDVELLENNPEQKYVQNMRADIKDSKEQKRTIRSTSLCGTNEVIYKTIDKRDCAYVTCSYFMKEGEEFKTTYQRYVLRRDDGGKWKILVYYIIEGE